MKHSFFLLLLFIASCSPKTQKEYSIDQLNAFMDNWHQAAAVADADAFFGAMTASGIYIGTDASERWLRDELREWAASAFERESAWAFTAQERNWQMKNGFWICDEVLDTWMGTCRSTAVLIEEGGELKIQHYQLSVTLPNEKVEAFKELVNMP